MKTRRASGIALAAALFAAAGCDFWSNLLEEKTLTRGDLEVDVVDAWTGEAMQGATCRDSLRRLEIAYEGNGAYRMQGAATGRYAVYCVHRWYHDGSAELGLTGAGARVTLKLARRGGEENWYPETTSQVLIPRPGGALRYPKNLDWLVTPTDTNGRFIYEWTFRNNPLLNRGHWVPQRQLPKDAYSPRFRVPVSRANIQHSGPDTVILKVFSLMHDPKVPEYVGTDSLPIEWVENKKPSIKFDSKQFFIDSNSYAFPRWKVGCGEPKKRKVLFRESDSDGQCLAIRLWTENAPSSPNFKTTIACALRDSSAFITVLDPKSVDPTDSSGSLGLDGALEYDNTLIAEIEDDNGETSRDTVHFRTYRNVAPTAVMTFDSSGSLQPPYRNYLKGDSVKFRIRAHDTDGYFNAIFVPWVGVKNNQALGEGNYMSNIPDGNDVEYQGFIHLDTPESTQVWATIQDNCGETFETPRNVVNVDASRPPSVKIIPHASSLVGDSVLLPLEIVVTDPDAVLYRDRIASIRIIWDDRDRTARNIDSISPNAQSYTWDTFHKYYRPESGQPIPISIRARDAHDSLTDTIYYFRPAGPQPSPAAPPPPAATAP